MLAKVVFFGIDYYGSYAKESELNKPSRPPPPAPPRASRGFWVASAMGSGADGGGEGEFPPWIYAKSYYIAQSD